MGGLFARFEASTGRILALALATLIVLVATAWVVAGEASKVRPAIQPRPMFPDLNIEDAASLEIRSSTGDVQVVLNGDGDWVVPARNGYPARPGPLLQTIGGLEELELLEAKTARADWHHFLGLVAPEDGGQGVEITLSDAQGDVLAGLIVGNQPEGNATEPDGRERIHVRRLGDDQTWVARGTLSLQTEVSEWLALHLYDIDGARVRDARVRTPSGEAYTLSRESAEDEEFELVDLPVGREILSPYVIEATATALSELEPEDVRTETDVDLSGGYEAIYRTFDGLELTFTIADPDGPDSGWATILARFIGAPNSTAEEAVTVAEEAANINVLADGWAFRLPRFQARQMTLDLDDLLRPLPDESGG